MVRYMKKMEDKGKTAIKIKKYIVLQNSARLERTINGKGNKEYRRVYK